jgi:hypothetical protein
MTTTNSAANHAATRIRAIRAEISDLKELIEAGMYKTSAKTMIRALERDLLEQEKRMHDALVSA